MNVSPGTEIKAAKRARLFDIDRAKGLAIILVVVGHVVARGTPPGAQWYSTMKSAIYLFHMPLFVYLSGVVFTYTRSEQRSGPGYLRWLGARAERLLVPFFAFGALIVAGKYVASGFMFVDDAPKGLLSGLSTMFVDTSTSPAVSIWFMFVLFVYCMITPLLLRLSGQKLLPWLLVAIALAFVQLPDVLYLDRIARFYVYFLAGCMVGRRHEETLAWLQDWRWAAYLVFAASFVLVPLDLPRSIKLFVIGSASIPAVHAFVSCGPLANSRLLLALGSFAFVIYLLNTVAIGLTKGVLLKFLPWGGPIFPAVALVLLAAGLLGPIIVKRVVFRRVPFLDRITS